MSQPILETNDALFAAVRAALGQAVSGLVSSRISTACDAGSTYLSSLVEATADWLQQVNVKAAGTVQGLESNWWAMEGKFTQVDGELAAEVGESGWMPMMAGGIAQVDGAPSLAGGASSIVSAGSGFKSAQAGEDLGLGQIVETDQSPKLAQIGETEPLPRLTQAGHGFKLIQDGE